MSDRCPLAGLPHEAHDFYNSSGFVSCPGEDDPTHPWEHLAIYLAFAVVSAVMLGFLLRV